MARSRIARLFPTLPPSASSASAMTAPHQRYTYVVKSRSNRSMRLVNSDPHRAREMKGGEHGVSNPTGRSFDQPKALCTERFGNTFDNLFIRNGVNDLVRTCCSQKIDFKVKIDCDTLQHFRYVLHSSIFSIV